MNNELILVIGATGQVGSQTAVLLARRGHRVRAMVRKTGKTIVDAPSGIEYVVGDLSDSGSVAAALEGVTTVVSTANGIIPQRKADNAMSVNEGSEELIRLCEKAGVRRFVQSSVPVHEIESQVPELAGKRVIEAALLSSSLQSIIVRNPAFTDVWLVMCGFQQAESSWPHATTRRNYGFMKMWRGLVGNFLQDRGWFIAPGGAKHGSPLIATRDVAELMAAGATYEGKDNRIFEAGGPQWYTWREIADRCAQAAGHEKATLIPMPAWFARAGQLMMRPFSPAAANVLALIRFVAEHQPHWENAEVVRELGLPAQQTLENYLKQEVRLTR